ncbi:MATE family efflux transporter [Phnomibacter ginsenosidimutans]|uniref:Multidrug-efflux transporter n=1 Tax=Phnomibacter ginsenosidimutans TaxID=2676868 RepID=A0A6I6H376_9BACT|nr:MATE family efflux transporter [Phnomibacter ginsenosidimutans]
MSLTNITRFFHRLFYYIRLSLSSEGQDFTTGSIRKAIFLLAVPMILELSLESVFALVDVFFVGKLGSVAISTVVLTESIITIVYSVGIGLSMAATAMVARRIGEKNAAAAAKAGAQSMLLGLLVSVLISIVGVTMAPTLLRLMGGSAEVIRMGTPYMRIMLGGNLVIMMLFLINGIFRGAGDASIAMKSLWIANICNIMLCPLLIQGWGMLPAFGLTGAALATTIGRTIGVLYQLYKLNYSHGVIHLKWSDFLPDKSVLASLAKVAGNGTLQFLIGSASWIFLARLVAQFGEDATAGYGVAIRLIVFFILPAWGLSNAAATLVGQNLGAGNAERAAKSVWLTAKYNALFMLGVTLLFFFMGEWLVQLLNDDVAIRPVAVEALRIVSLGYVLYGISMVMMNAFNGAGDTKTPTIINLIFFWGIQIPLAYILSISWKLGPTGVFVAIVSAESLIAVVAMWLFTKGKWKAVKI